MLQSIDSLLLFFFEQTPCASLLVKDSERLAHVTLQTGLALCKHHRLNCYSKRAQDSPKSSSVSANPMRISQIFQSIQSDVKLSCLCNWIPTLVLETLGSKRHNRMGSMLHETKGNEDIQNEVQQCARKTVWSRNCLDGDTPFWLYSCEEQRIYLSSLPT